MYQTSAATLSLAASQGRVSFLARPCSRSLPPSCHRKRKPVGRKTIAIKSGMNTLLDKIQNFASSYQDGSGRKFKESHAHVGSNLVPGGRLAGASAAAVGSEQHRRRKMGPRHDGARVNTSLRLKVNRELVEEGGLCGLPVEPSGKGGEAYGVSYDIFTCSTVGCTCTVTCR